MELKIRKSWNYKSITIQIPEDVKIKPLYMEVEVEESKSTPKAE